MSNDSHEIKPDSWNTSYEWKIVLLLALGFGLVGMDRFVIATLWPAMSEDLGLPVEMVGDIAGYTALAWGFFALIMGRMADKWGHRKILITATVVFTLTGGLTGTANALVFLVVIRVIMGAMEGAYIPTAVTAVAVASKPHRRGMNQGAQQCLVSLLGLAIAPIVASQLLAAGYSWRIIFWIIAAPGFIIAFLLWRVLKEPKDTDGAAALRVEVRDAGWGEIFKSYGTCFKTYNVVMAMLCLLCTMSPLFILSAMVPVYLANVIQLDIASMGVVTAAIGFGGFFGQFGWPTLSDKLGRKTCVLLGFVGSSIAIYWFSQVGGGVMALFIPLFVCCFFALGNIAVITGPVATESAPPSLVAATIGIVIGIGEIFGGGVAPIIASSAATAYGLPAILTVALISSVVGIFVTLFLKETAPIKIGAAAPQTAMGDVAEDAVDETGPVV